MRGTTVFFYELHEGDEEVFSDVLLVHEEGYEPDEFFELVQSIRHQIQGSYEEDTLIEAIAAELERNHGFTFISDARIDAAVNVSVVEDDNFLIQTSDEIESDASEALRAEYRGILVDMDDESHLN